MNLKNVSGYLMCMEMEAALSEKEKCCPGIILLGDARLPVLNVSIPDARRALSRRRWRRTIEGAPITHRGAAAPLKT